eukprot:g264.t1
MQRPKLALCVESWSSEENLFAWNFTRKRLLQDTEPSRLTDRIYVVHVNTKTKEDEPWDKGTAVLADVRTELANYDHSIVELEGEPVTAIIQFLNDEGIDVAIVSLKDQRNRVKRRMVSNCAHQIFTRASCACVIVSPRFSAGDHFRMQAKRQPDALVANSVLQYRRRVLVLLNTGLWDSALTQYTAKHVSMSGDLVILVRCVNENLHRKNADQFQIERDNMRELGWHKFKQNDVSLAVEVVKNTSRNLCEFIESKGIDLLIMTGSDTNKLKSSVKKESAFSQTFYERCPCPFMFVPTEILKHCMSHLPFQGGSSSSRSFLFSSLNRLRRRAGFPGRFSVFSQKSPFRSLVHSRRCQSFGSTEHPELHSLDHLRSDSVDYASNTVPGMEMTELTGTKETENSVQASAPQLSVANEGKELREEEVRELQQELSEKEKQITMLKECISHLQKSDGNE